MWDFKEEIWGDISLEGKDFIKKLLQLDARKRLSAVEALKHPWITNQVKTRFSQKLGKDAMEKLTAFQGSANFVRLKYFLF